MRLGEDGATSLTEPLLYRRCYRDLIETVFYDIVSQSSVLLSCCLTRSQRMVFLFLYNTQQVLIDKETEMVVLLYNNSCSFEGE